MEQLQTLSYNPYNLYFQVNLAGGEIAFCEKELTKELYMRHYCTSPKYQLHHQITMFILKN